MTSWRPNVWRPKGSGRGNTSAGRDTCAIAPAFGCPAVNIGSRQLARLRAGNVIDTDYNAEEIEAALRRALYDEPFRALCRTATNPYGTGDAGKKIANVLATVDL